MIDVTIINDFGRKMIMTIVPMYVVCYSPDPLCPDRTAAMLLNGKTIFVDMTYKEFDDLMRGVK